MPDQVRPPAPLQSTGNVPGRAGKKESPFFVPPWLHFLGSVVHQFPGFWLWLGRLESSLLEDRLNRVSLQMPIYISGLARSGSTLLHEVISSHPQVATLRIKDYPMVFTPYWWRQATANWRPQPPRERPHRDRMMIAADSPDALEEMLWMAFFPHCHTCTASNLLEAGTRHPGFERFYRAHIRKLLLAEGATRYAAKANYHITRLPYLARLFPDVRFLLPVRNPASHIASLIRQHRWFSLGHRRHARALALMQRSGHFEFGLDRRPIHLGDAEQVRQIARAWADGEEVRGQTRYWNMVYGYLAKLLAGNAQIRTATLVVRYESLCESPQKILQSVFDHCRLPGTDGIVRKSAAGIHFPDYYKTNLSAADLEFIRTETQTTARLWGY